VPINIVIETTEDLESIPSLNTPFIPEATIGRKQMGNANTAITQPVNAIFDEISVFNNIKIPMEKGP